MAAKKTKKGQWIVTDDRDRDLLEFGTWWVTHDGYVRGSYGYDSSDAQVRMYLRRAIMERIEGRELLRREKVIHINGDKLNHFRSNLAIVAQADLLSHPHTKVHKNSTTGVKGVERRRGKFVAVITRNKKRSYLGIYDTVEEAQSAYAAAASKVQP